MLWLRKARQVASVKYDFVICGGGSAGCVLANRLSADKSKNVLLLEAGPSDKFFSNRLGKLISWKIHMPAALQYNLQDDKLNWYYETVPQKHANNRSFYWPRGRVLGGSSSLNAMVYVRGHGKDQDRWAQEIGDEQWNYDHVLPYFIRAQNFHGAIDGDTYKGTNGFLHVTDGEFNTPLYEAFVQAGIQAGYPKTEDVNGYQQEGFGKLPMTVYKNDGSRANTSSCYLDPARHRENLKILPNTLAEKVIFNGTTATGIDISSFKAQTDTVRIEAKEIILCGGSINSPQMLQLSGIGNYEELKKHEIQPIVHLPGVGENLQDHLEIPVSNKTLSGLSLKKYQMPPLMQLIGAEWFLRGTGVCATNHFHAGAFIRSKAAEDLDHPDIQLHFVPSQYLDHGRGEIEQEAFQAHVGTLRAKSTGHVKIRSRNPRDHPEIDPKYLSNPDDLPDLVTCLKLTREIFAQAAFDELRLEELIPGKELITDREMADWVKSIIETVYHPSSTCKMGREEDPMTVVDSKCRVLGTEGLRVVDASIMPSIASGNLNAPTIAIAEKAADIILGKDPLILPNSRYFLSDTSCQR